MTHPPAPGRNLVWARALVDELVRAGVAHACLSPGSRSTPLAWALAERAGLTGAPAELALSVHLDERCAGFYALGLARATGRPVALACTSGSAGAHYLPALIEAHHARVGLVVLTADRPPERHEIGDWQTIAQRELFGPFVRWRDALQPADLAPELLRDLRGRAARAVALAAGRGTGAGPGPVHLDVPLREPLEPFPAAELAPPAAAMSPWDDGRPGGAPYVALTAAAGRLASAAVAALADAIAAEPRGLVLAGGLDAPPTHAAAVAALAAAAEWPVLAEPTGGLRFGPHDARRVITGYDAALRHAPWAQRHAPAMVLRLGASFTWKHVAAYLGRHPDARQVVVDPHGTWDDPTARAGERLACDPTWLCDALARALAARRPAVARRAAAAAAWQAAWDAVRAASARTRAALRSDEAAAAGTAWIHPAVVDALPEGALLWVANSMAVRDLDTWTEASPRAVRVVASRGAAGIDGTVSSALGAARGAAVPSALLTGDLAFLHDAGGLAAAHEPGTDLAIVIVDDHGGGIFEHLPVAATDRALFERLFATPQRVDLAALCRAHAVPMAVARDAAALRDALAEHRGAVRCIHVPVDRAANTAAHRAYWRAVAAALDAEATP